MTKSWSLGLGTVLLGLWLLLWGSPSVANLLSGVLVVGTVLVLIPVSGHGVSWPTVRPVWALRFVGRVLWSLLRANVMVAQEAVTAGSSLRTGIVAVPMDHCSDGLLTLVANVLGMAPGTMPVEVTRTPPVIYVHLLHLDDVERVRGEITQLTELGVRAFGSDEAVAALP